jgi:hypothetical protein
LGKDDEKKKLAAPERVSKFESILSCQICMHKYDRQKRVPLCLKCGHTVCEQCAKSLIKYGRIKCPFDNQSFDHVNVELLGRNFTLLDLIDAEKQEA